MSQGSEIDAILKGHRSQGPVTKSPGQSKNWLLFLLEVAWYLKLLTYRHRHFDEIFWQSHHLQWCDETKISSRQSQVTRCDELIELVRYVMIKDLPFQWD